MAQRTVFTEVSGGRRRRRVDDGGAGRLVEVDVDAVHQRGEQLVIAGGHDQLDDLAGREGVASGGERRLRRAALLDHLGRDAQDEAFARVEARGLGVPALERRDLLVGDADREPDRHVLDPFVLGAGEPCHAQDRQLAQAGVELLRREDRLAEAKRRT